MTAGETDPLTVDCPHCHAVAGESCMDVRCREEVPVHQERVADRVRDRGRAELLELAERMQTLADTSRSAETLEERDRATTEVARLARERMRLRDGQPKRPRRRQLSTEAGKLRKQILAEYSDIDGDPAALSLLNTAVKWFDGYLRASAIVDTEGQVIREKGRQKQHPAIAIAKTAHRQYLDALKALHLDWEPLRDKAGRPPGT